MINIHISCRKNIENVFLLNERFRNGDAITSIAIFDPTQGMVLPMSNPFPDPSSFSHRSLDHESHRLLHYMRGIGCVLHIRLKICI